MKRTAKFYSDLINAEEINVRQIEIKQLRER